MSRALLVAILVALWLPEAQGATPIPAPPQPAPVALVGGVVHPVSGADIAVGTILFARGKIVAVGKDVLIPKEATVIDVSGKHVYPALINAYTSVGLTEVGSVRGTVDRVEAGLINPNVRSEVSVNPESEIIAVTRANGIALVVSAPSGGTISGQSAILRLDGWTWEEMTFKAPCALHVNWPNMTLTRSRYEQRSEAEQKQQRDQALAALDSAFSTARAYGQSKAVASDLRWEAMQPALTGELPVMVFANSIQEIEGAVGWAAAQGLRLIILGGADAWRVTDLLVDKKVPVIVTGCCWVPSRQGDAYDDPFTVAARLYKAGVKFCISSVASAWGGGEASNARNLPYEAAMAAAYGLPKPEALKAVTLYPAQILGVADRVGSLEVGKDATLIVTNGDPLEIPTQVDAMYIEGRRVDLSSRHTQLYDKYRQKYRKP